MAAARGSSGLSHPGLMEARYQAMILMKRENHRWLLQGSTRRSCGSATHVTPPERAALVELQAIGLLDVVRDRWPRERVLRTGITVPDVPSGSGHAHRPGAGFRAGDRSGAGRLGGPARAQGYRSERPCPRRSSIWTRGRTGASGRWCHRPPHRPSSTARSSHPSSPATCDGCRLMGVDDQVGHRNEILLWPTSESASDR
jgi:hypothetical protein